MIIRRIKLHNFRQFRGFHTIDFSVDKNKNVTVVMGENGSGKTTLEQAFIWCLYGSTNFTIQELINRDVRDSMINGDEVIVSVELLINYNNHEYCIVRKQCFEKKTSRVNKSSKDIFLVKEQNVNGEFEALPDLKGLATIREFMPEELSSFFFFDGERLEHMSKELLEHKRSDNFKGAVRGLVGLTAMLEAIGHLGQPGRKSGVIGNFDKLIDDVGNANLTEIAGVIDNLMIKQDNIKKQINDWSAEEARYNDDMISFQVELKNMQDDIDRRKEYERLQVLQQNEEREKVKDRQALYSYFAKHSFGYLILPLLKEALGEIKTADKLDKGIPHIHADTIKFLLERGKCICGSDICNGDEATKHLEALMLTLPPYSIGNMIGQFANQASSLAVRETDFYEQLKLKTQVYQKHDAVINNAVDRCADLEKHIANKDKVNSIKVKLSTAKGALSRLRQDIINARTECLRITDKVKKLENQREQIRKTNSKNRQNMVYLEYAKVVWEKLKTTYDEKEDAVRFELEGRINKIFEDIYDGGIQISVDGNYNISTTIITDSGEYMNDLEKNTAQSYAIIFAFIAGIIEMAKSNNNDETNDGFPLVMDAPLSAFDKERIKKICTVLPTIAEQVIIFIKDTDGDIAEEYMDDIIGKKWLIKKNSETSSSLEERVGSYV